MAEFNKVKNYMTKDVITVTEDTTPVEIQNMIKKTGHDGFPVQNNENKIVGIVTASDLITKDFTPTIRDMMSTDIVVANEELTINDAARVMFRMGISRLPVTNEEEGVIGIITNTDILRSHIERSTPTKVNQFRTSLEQLYDIKTTLHEENVPIKLMKPTQDKIYADELQGRTYEIERGLAEPVILVKTNDKYVVVDGHHRIVAAYQ